MTLCGGELYTAGFAKGSATSNWTLQMYAEHPSISLNSTAGLSRAKTAFAETLTDPTAQV